MPSLRTSSLLVLLTCLFSLSIFAAPTETITDFKIGDNIELFLFGGDYKFFKFQLPNKLEAGYDLSIVANPYGDNDPELYLSTREKYPKTPETSEYYSTSYGYSSIYVPEKKLRAKAEYYLGVSCASDICGFNLTIDYALDYYMRANVTDLIIDAQNGGTLVTRVYVPKSTTASHIVFAAEIENLKDIEQGIQMFANAGNEIPTSTKHDVVATQSWGDGKAAFIYKSDKNFCTDCNYTIVMEIPRGSKVTFTRTVYGDIINMALDTTRNDAVEADQKVTYAVDISKLNASQAIILCEITPYYGFPYIYAHLGSAPSKLEDYSFKAKARAQELLEIPITNKPANNILYVTVYGKNHTTYTLNVWQNNKKLIFLPLGEPEIGQISGKGIQNYLVVAEGRKDMTMTFSVHPEQGKVDLFVKSCSDKTLCNFTVEETNKILSGEIKTSKKNPILQYSNVPDGDEVVTFDMDGSSCSPNSNTGLPRCAFVVAVLSTDDKAARYTVTANRNGLHQELRANHPVREHSQMDQYKYYYFGIENDVGIISVNFQVTKISGDVNVYISRKTKYPDSNDREDPLHYNDLYSFFKDLANNGVNGTFYIAVKAETSATYSIVPIIEYDTSAVDISGHHLMKLSEGIPQKMVIDNTNAAYFKFDVEFYKGIGKHQNIEISLNEVQGSFEICATDSLAFPERGNCQYSSNSTTLFIPLDDNMLFGSFSYFIGVFPKATASNSSKAQSFSITWSASHNFRTLGFNTPFWNSASHNRSVFYKFEVHPNEDKEILIYKFTYSSSYNLTQIYLADQETKLGHDVTAFNYQRTTNGTSSNLIKLNQTDLQELCRTTGSGVESKCYLYLAVTSTSQSEDYFTLLLSKDYYSELGLTEGMQANFPFPMTNHPLKLFYYPHQIADITILAESWARNITLYANIVRPNDYSSKKDWIYPTNKKFEYSSKSSASRQGESSLVIDAESLSDCGEFDKFRCGVAITLYHQSSVLELQNKNPDSLLTGFSTFSILATQDILPIGTGKPIHTYVNEGQYKYFRLSCNKDMATLFISGSIISGRDMIIFASKGRDARPTEHNYEFRGSLFAKVETLEISPDETKDGNTKGDWVIAVYGQTNTDFVLNVLFEKNKMIEMYQGLPVNAIASKDPIYFRYTQYGSASQMKITKERGSGIVSYKRYNKDAPLNDLPQKDAGIVKKFDQVQLILDFKSQSGWDADTYIIAIFPDSEMKVSAVIQAPGEFIYLVDNMIFSDYAASGIVNKYEHLALSTDVLDINMVVYSGDPKIYVSHNPTVNATNKIWASEKSSSKNYIRMKLDNTPYKDKKTPLEVVWDGKNNISSYQNAYYIMVVSNVPSNYSIAVSVSNSTRHLIDGHMDFGFLNSGEKNVYKYHVAKPSGPNNKFSTLKLQFILHRDKFFDALGEKIQKPNIIVMAAPAEKLEQIKINPKTGLPDFEKVDPFNSDIAERSYGDQNYIMNLQYRAISGSDFYIIVNNMESQNHLNYSITANSHEPIYLAMNNIYSSRVDINERDIYAVHASTAGLLVIEIHECMGRVAVQTSPIRNFDKAAINPGSAASSLGSHIVLSSIEIKEEQTLYLAVSGVERAGNTALPSLDAIYKIKVNIFPLRNYLPFMNLYPGNDGQVEWDVTNSGNVQLAFNDVNNNAFSDKAMKSTKFGNLNIQYHYDVFLAKDSQVSDYMSRCDLIPEDSYIYENATKYSKTLSYDKANLTKYSADNALRTIEFAPEGEFDKLYAAVRVTAIGVDESGQHVWDYPLLYRPVEIRNIRNVVMNKFLVVLLGICLVMLTLAIIGVMYYYKKFERVKVKLNYEMQDLRNLATTVESFDNYQDTLGDSKKGGYAGLVEEEP